MIGKRVHPSENGAELLEPGAYGQFDGRWLGCTPSGDLASLAAHHVVEHEDGTISVSPSILVSTTRDGVPVECWHGFLERGVWRSC